MTTINHILEEICKVGSLYDEIIDTIIYSDTNKQEDKYALLSEIANYWLQSPDNVIKAWDNKYFKYYFIRTVQNQVHSNTSAYHKNHRVKDKITWDRFNDCDDCDSLLESSIIDLDDGGMEKKILAEIRLNDVERSINLGQLTWVEGQLFKEYYYEDKTYRQIEEEYGIDHVSAWKIVKSATKKVKEFCNK